MIVKELYHIKKEGREAVFTSGKLVALHGWPLLIFFMSTFLRNYFLCRDRLSGCSE